MERAKSRNLLRRGVARACRARTLQSANRCAIDAQMRACATAEIGMTSAPLHVGCARYTDSQTGCV
eukprot:7775780-Lingulodinium_polyedra.AAC.1